MVGIFVVCIWGYLPGFMTIWYHLLGDFLVLEPTNEAFGWDDFPYHIYHSKSYYGVDDHLLSPPGWLAVFF